MTQPRPATVIAPLLEICLEPVVSRQRRVRRYRGWAVVWIGVAALAGLLVLSARASGWWWNGVPFLLAGLALIGCMVASARARRWEPDYTELARRIEGQHPEVRDLLRTAVEQKSDGTHQLSYLQQRVVSEAVQAAEEESWVDTVPPGRMAAAHGLHLAALAGLVVLLFNLPKEPPAVKGISGQTTAGVDVTPGDISIERGTGLAILARFKGAVPANVTLVVTPDGAESKSIALVKSLDDPVFGATMSEIKADTRYLVDHDGTRTRQFTIRVFDYPRLERADADLTFPEYTGFSPKRIEDTRRVSAVEGTRVDYQLQLNKPVAQARLLARDHPPIELAAHTNRASLALTNFVVRKNIAYELELIDTEGRTNKTPAQLVFQAISNRAPELKLAFPRGDQRVSPIQEVNFDVEAWDEFGVNAVGLTFRVGLADPQSIVLAEHLKANQRTNVTYQLKLEEHSVNPDDLVSYYMWAEDVGPDGEPRRVESDMFFAEVRPFEEIFREDESQQSGGQPPGGAAGGGQQGEQTDELIEIQKQVITASWNLHRQRAGTPPEESFKLDVEVVHESQQQALEQAEALKEMARTEEASRLISAATDAMDKAAARLEEAKEQPLKLTEALSHEQEAYQALLKLQAHEYRVSQARNQSAQGQRGSRGNRNRQQLDQLDLRQSENRYATENQAQEQRDPAQQEQIQALNRLRELARRQEDINERLKELQTALQAAETEEEREEIRRRLRRLREDQQQMLADVDELRERMDRPENQSQMAEARQQLDQARSQVQQASESLENNNVPEALSAGTRAERNLEELRDDFRQQNSNQFAEEMRQMRDQARDLGSRQEDVARQLEELTQAERKTLTDTPERAALRQNLSSQEQGLTNLLQNMTRVTQEAEATEPLLARQLYDTVRQTHQGNLNDSLRLTRELVENSFLQQARPFEQQTRRQLQDLRRGVEGAAQSILGDDTEALRLARSELEALSNQIDREMNQATGAAREGDTNALAGAAGGPAEPGSTNQLAQAGQEQTGQAQRGRQGDGQEREEASASAEGNQSGQPRDGQGQAGQTAQQEGEQGEREGQANAPSSLPQPGSGQQGQGQQAQAGQGQGAPQPGQQPGQGQGQGQGEQPGQQGQGQGQGQGGQAQAGQESAQPGEDGQQGQAQNQGQRSGQGGGPGGPRFFDSGGPDSNRGGGSGPASGPITGEGYRDWSDRMRYVEEMLQEPDQRAEVSTIRERVRAMRAEAQRHAREPQWDLVQAEITQPMMELQNRIQEELARRQSEQALVPIDRDPVPRAFSELVRRYYERLGQGD